MKAGTAGLELEVTLSFHDDGTESGLSAMVADGETLPVHVSKVLWDYLRDLRAADQLREAAWWEATQDDRDDAERERRRPLSHGEIEANRNRDEIEEEEVA